jgi:hypothetical protein
VIAREINHAGSLFSRQAEQYCFLDIQLINSTRFLMVLLMKSTPRPDCAFFYFRHRAGSAANNDKNDENDKKKQELSFGSFSSLFKPGSLGIAGVQLPGF